MNAFRLLARSEVEAFGEPQHHQGDEPLTVGWAFIDIVVAERRVDRSLGRGALPVEVLHRMTSAEPLELRHDLLGDRSVVEGPPATPPDRPERPGESRHAVELALGGRATARQVG